MVRPTKQDRDSIAITHVRISSKTKELLDRLKLEGRYKTYDQVLLSLILSPGQPQSSKALTITDIMQRPDVNKLIGDTARQVYHNYVKPGSRPKSKSKPKLKQSNKTSFGFGKSSHKF